VRDLSGLKGMFHVLDQFVILPRSGERKESAASMVQQRVIFYNYSNNNFPSSYLSESGHLCVFVCFCHNLRNGFTSELFLHKTRTSSVTLLFY